MSLQIEALPETADAGLAELHADLQRIVDNTEQAIESIQGDRRRTLTRREIDADFARRDALGALDELAHRVWVDRKHFVNRRAALRILPATGETLLRHQEVRASLRALTGPKRDAALKQALTKQDQCILLAIIDGAACLVGMDADGFAGYRKQAVDAIYGDELREIEAGEALAADLETLIGRARDHVSTLGKEEIANAV